ncbi:hypothetical protein P4110_11165 [Pseudomonas aeruginosa]|nr:hypothetical protein [Pseudomonas aeruginosa]
MPYAERNGIIVLAYGALCRGLLSGRMNAETRFDGDDLRKSDPRFKRPSSARYLAAVAQLEELARERFMASRCWPWYPGWVLDRGPTVALWGAQAESRWTASPTPSAGAQDSRAKAIGPHRVDPRREPFRIRSVTEFAASPSHNA